MRTFLQEHWADVGKGRVRIGNFPRFQTPMIFCSIITFWYPRQYIHELRMLISYLQRERMRHQAQIGEVGIQRKCLKQSSRTMFQIRVYRTKGLISTRLLETQAHVGQYERSACEPMYARVSNKKDTQK
jgi:hypothetical protein